MHHSTPTQVWFLPYIDGVHEDFSCYTDDGLGSMRDGRIMCRDSYTEDICPDWLCAGGSPYATARTNVPKERRICFLSEPPSVLKYELEYLNQFGIVITTSKFDRYMGQQIVGNQCAGWFIGVGAGGSEGVNQQFFKKLQDVRDYRCKKIKLASIVTSSKNFTEGHKNRLRFLEEMRERFDGVIDVFGREFHPINDKIEAIAPYKYHISIENSSRNFYWTEKLTDAWIGWSLPIYYGDPTILSQVPDTRGIEIIDINNPREALEKIDQILKNVLLKINISHVYS